MSETRAELKERLQAAGLWRQYVARREQLAAEGLTPAQAREQALREVESLPPRPRELPPEEGPGEGPEPAAEVGGFPDFGRSVPNTESVQWVAEHIADAGVRPPDAPSGLAWSLLQWVRLTPANQSTFWSSVWPRLAPKEEGQDWDGTGPCPTCGVKSQPTKEEEQYDQQMEHLMAKEWAEVQEALKIIRSRQEQGLPPLAAEGVPGDEIPEGGPGEWR
jgi:hypothetical protein